MKILLLIDSLGVGGAETHVCDLARELARLGHDVTVASSGGECSARLKAYGVRHIKACFLRRGVIRSAIGYFRLRSLARRERFDVIHAHSRRAAYIGERIARHAGVCFVTSAHARFSVSPIKKYMSRWGYYVSAVSEDIAAYLTREYGVLPERISIIPNGVDTECFSPAEDGEAAEERRIVFVSRLDADCSAAAYALCRMGERLDLRYCKIRITIVGGGSEYEALLRLAAHMNRIIGYRAIELTGELSDVRGVLRGAEVFVGVSRAALEAMSSGVNTVLAGNEGHFGAVTPENVSLASKDNFCGRESEGFDPRRLEAELIGILDMPHAEARARGEAVRRYVTENHSASECAKRTVDFYKRALETIDISGRGACLCGYYGFGNVGDDTLLREAVKRARKTAGGGISALTRSPKADRYSFGVRCVRRSDLFCVWREIAASERLIFGGGTLFQDRTSLRSLLYYCALSELAHIHGVRVELWGNGLGVIKSRLGRALLRRVLKNAAYIGLRDKHSYEYARSLGIPASALSLEADLAYSAEPIESARVRAYVKEGARERVIVSISGSVSREVYERVRFEVNSRRRAGAEVLVVVMYPREDARICERLALECEGSCISGLCTGEVLYLCEHAKLCISTRLHLLIFADMAGCSFIGGGEDPKIRDFCKEKGGLLI